MKCNECSKIKCEDCGEVIDQTGTNVSSWPPYAGTNFCMHDNCLGCKDGTCNGVHMISCHCSKCSPRYSSLVGTK